MSKLGEFLKSYVPTANPANPANPYQNISKHSNISSRANENAHPSADLESRILAMAKRWNYSDDELTHAISLIRLDRGKATAWVERDERIYGDCVTPADFAAAYARFVIRS